MPAPPEFRTAFIVTLAKALGPAIDRAWDAAKRAERKGVTPEREANAPPKARGPRLRRGMARQAVQMAIAAYDDKGASREDLRRIIPRFTGGVAMPENTLKRVLMILREEGKIETRNSRWWPAR